MPNIQKTGFKGHPRKQQGKIGGTERVGFVRPEKKDVSDSDSEAERMETTGEEVSETAVIVIPETTEREEGSAQPGTSSALAGTEVGTRRTRPRHKASSPSKMRTRATTAKEEQGQSSMELEASFAAGTPSAQSSPVRLHESDEALQIPYFIHTSEDEGEPDTRESELQLQLSTEPSGELPPPSPGRDSVVTAPAEEGPSPTSISSDEAEKVVDQPEAGGTTAGREEARQEGREPPEQEPEPAESGRIMSPRQEALTATGEGIPAVPKEAVSDSATPSLVPAETVTVALDELLDEEGLQAIRERATPTFLEQTTETGEVVYRVVVEEEPESEPTDKQPEETASTPRQEQQESGGSPEPPPTALKPASPRQLDRLDQELTERRQQALQESISPAQFEQELRRERQRQEEAERFRSPGDAPQLQPGDVGYESMLVFQRMREATIERHLEPESSGKPGDQSGDSDTDDRDPVIWKKGFEGPLPLSAQGQREAAGEGAEIPDDDGSEDPERRGQAARAFLKDVQEMLSTSLDQEDAAPQSGDGEAVGDSYFDFEEPGSDNQGEGGVLPDIPEVDVPPQQPEKGAEPEEGLDPEGDASAQEGNTIKWGRRRHARERSPDGNPAERRIRDDTDSDEETAAPTTKRKTRESGDEDDNGDEAPPPKKPRSGGRSKGNPERIKSTDKRRARMKTTPITSGPPAGRAQNPTSGATPAAKPTAATGRRKKAAPTKKTAGRAAPKRKPPGSVKATPSTSGTGQPRAPAGVAALRQIRSLQRSTKNLLKEAPFIRTIKGIVGTFPDRYNEKRFSASAVIALQEAAQRYILDVMGGAAFAAAHAKRVTAMVQDVWLVMELSGENRRRGSTFPRLTLKEATKYIPPTGLEAMGHRVELLPIDSRRSLRGATRTQHGAMPAGARPDPSLIGGPMEGRHQKDFEEPFTEEAHQARQAEAQRAAGVAPAWAKEPVKQGKRRSQRQQEMRAAAAFEEGEPSRSYEDDPETSRPEDEQ